MIEFQTEDRTQQRMVGTAATVVYAVVVLLLLLLVKFTITPPSDEGEGLLVDFGNIEEAAPGIDPAMNDQIAEEVQQQRPAEWEQVDEEQLTQDFEETDVEVKEKKKEEKKPQQKVESEKTTPKPEQKPVEKPREVNRRALFPGRTANSTSTSEGTGTGSGNQGNLAGSPEGSHEGTGTGTGGNSASLAGRSLVGALPTPDYSARDQGKVVIEIYVDQQGRVTKADYRSQGSTTGNSSLVASAKRAAMQARFNVDEDAPLSQKGTITYNFRMQ